jgi:hypothetical protein
MISADELTVSIDSGMIGQFEDDFRDGAICALQGGKG